MFENVVDRRRANYNVIEVELSTSTLVPKGYDDHKEVIAKLSRAKAQG